MYAKQISGLFGALVLAAFATNASAGTRTALLQVSMQITETCQVHAQSTGQAAVQPSQVAVSCAFQAPHRVSLAPQAAEPSSAAGVSQTTPAGTVTTLVF